MRSDEAVSTYARTLFDMATLTDSVDAADEGLASVVKAVRGHVDLRETLADAAVPSEKKRDIMREIFGGTVSPEVLSVAGLMVDRGQIDMLGDVARVFGEIAEERRGIVAVEAVTAIALTDDLRASLKNKLSASLGRPVVLRERVDASILGGIVIKVAGRVLDGSVKSQLSALRQALVSAPVGGEA